MNNASKQPLAVWWALWASFFIGIFFFYHFLGRASESQPPGTKDSPIFLVGLVPLLVSVIIRWFVLPRLNNAATALPVFIVGIALAEATCFLGLFVFPAHKEELFIASATGIFQFAPYFAHRFSVRQ